MKPQFLLTTAISIFCSLLFLLLCRAVVSFSPAAGSTIAMDEMGVRKFSKVHPPGVHPRVLMSPEDIDPWRQSVVLTAKGKAFFSKRYHSGFVYHSPTLAGV